VAALEAEARSAGVKLMTGARVEEILREGGDSTLRHARGEVRVGIVVNAAGADAGRVAALAGSSVPVDPVRRNLALFLDPAANAGAPMCVDLDTGVLVRPEGSSGWIAAYSDPLDPPGRDISLDPRFLEQLAERAPHRFPFLTDLPVDPARCWAGLYPETPDHHAIVGFDPAVPGLVHCAGFGGHGIMHAPAAGRAVAELVTTGSCETFDLRPLRPSRFAEGDLVAETSVF
jgi:sarcosine oxidase subunit beta